MENHSFVSLIFCMRAMEILKAKKLPFGISACYTSANVYDVGSEAYFDKMVE